MTTQKTIDYFKESKDSKVKKTWGLGIEHEMQIFHKNKNDTIIFDAQEAVCFVTGDDGDYLGITEEDRRINRIASACCKKMREQCYYYPKSKKKQNMLYEDKKNRITDKEYDLLIGLDWELSGRQVRECGDIVKRIPRLMPELVTTNFRNRSIQSIVNESIDQENTLIAGVMRSPFTREKVATYGKLTTHLCGTVSNVKVPKKPTITKKKYEYVETKYKDYVGSYHITMTLPHNPKIKVKEFVKLHQNAANAIQWLQPLLLTAFFTGDPESVADGNDKAVRGSYRIMNVGWGNLAGSDVRKMGTTGLNRGDSIKSFWRKGMRFKGLHKLNDCIKKSKPVYDGSLSILTSDFRTFGQVDIDNFYEMEYCRENFNPSDCPRLDGTPMAPPYGMEIRIFDHFPSKYLLDLMKILILISANSVRHAPESYVYENKAWIEQLQTIMSKGWNGPTSNKYINALNKNLGLELRELEKDEVRNGFDLFKEVVEQLFKLNKDSEILALMDEKPKKRPYIPDINRQCWEMSFKSKLYEEFTEHIKMSGVPLNKWLYMTEFKQLFFRREKGNMTEKKIGHQLDDIILALTTLNKAEVMNKKGSINKVIFYNL